MGDDPRAADALAVIARDDLAADRIDAARLALERARALAPGHPELASLIPRLDARSAALARDDEARARQRLAAGDLDGAESIAREVVARWSGSAAARAVLRDVSAQRADHERAAAQVRLDAALAADDLGLAEEAARKLRELGAPGDAFEPRVAALRKRQRGARVEREVARVLAALERDVTVALRIWADADADVRDAACARSDAPVLRWIQQAAPRGGRVGGAGGRRAAGRDRAVQSGRRRAGADDGRGLRRGAPRGARRGPPRGVGHPLA